MTEKKLYLLMIVLILMLVFTAFLSEGYHSVLTGFVKIQSHPARLINDYTIIGSEGGALLNCSIVGLIGLFLVYINNVRLSGPTIAAVFTMMGFGLFGKTPLNIIPIIFGVFLLAKLVRKKFSEYIIIALFGTALGPMINYVILESGLKGNMAIFIGVTSGVVAGLLLPPIAIAMLNFHQGYNLYNLGLSCGFFAIFAAAVFSSAGFDLTIKVIWNKNPSTLLVFLVPTISILFLIAGVLLDYKKFFLDFSRILKLSGRLPSDFMEMVSASGALINIGLLGLICSLYVYLVGADFNGPVIGGIFTVMGFGAFGKHVKNSIPVIAGVALSCMVFGKALSAPGAILAALFGTTLAPIAGEFGFLAGISAGFIHSILVDRTAAWHGGMDLYNNGFAGGLTATLIIAVIDWYVGNKDEMIFFRKQKKHVNKE